MKYSPPSLPNWNPVSNSQLMSVGWNLRWQLVESAQIDRPVTLLAQRAKIFHDSEIVSSFLWVFRVILLVIFPDSPHVYLFFTFIIVNMLNKCHFFRQIFRSSYVSSVSSSSASYPQKNLGLPEVITYSAAMNSASKTGDWAMATALLRQLETGPMWPMWPWQPSSSLVGPERLFDYRNPPP